jgi:hypothetical protein
LFHKRFLAALVAASTVAGCAAPPAPPHPSAELGTVAPAYPVGELEPGVEVLEAIPVIELSDTEPLPFAGTDLCESVPEEVVEGATPVSSDQRGCIWDDPNGMTVEIGAWEGSMATEVEEHLAMANGRTADSLAHLAWLRIDDHHAIERILEADPTKTCYLTLDVSAPATFYVSVYRIKSTTEPDTATSVRELCPTARKIANNLLDHIDAQKPGWWEPDPTR